MRAGAVRAAAVVSLAAVLLAACGEKRLSKDELITQADVICKEANDKLEAAGKQLGQNPTPEQIQALAEGAIPTINGALTKLRALKPPKDDQQTIDNLWDKGAAIVPPLRQLADAAKAKDEAAVGVAFQKVEAVNTEFNQLAQSYGFKECGEEAE